MASPSFKIGMGVEDRVIAMLQRSGFTILQDNALDHEYKIDFVIQSFPENLSFDSIGVQLTCYLNHADKMRVFAEASQKRHKFRRCLYLEIHQNVNLEKDVRFILNALLTSFQFDREYADRPVMGARIFADGTYRIYDLHAMIQQLQQTVTVANKPIPIVPPAASPAPAPPAVATVRESKCGVLMSFCPEKGFGFINCKGVDYFFHINHVHDEQLREELYAIPLWTEMADLDRSVLFLDMGVTKKDMTRPEARDIRLRN